MIKKFDFLKDKKIKILLLVQLSIILFGVIIMCGQGRLIVSNNIDELIFDGVELSEGSYTLTLKYETANPAPGDFGANFESYGFKQIIGNNVPIFQGANIGECDFIVTRKIENFKPIMNLAEDVNIKSLELVKDSRWIRIILFAFFVLSLVLDGVLVLKMYDRKVGIGKDVKTVIAGILVVTFISSIPLLVDYTIIGADIIYHMMRIEALKNSIVQGELSARMQSLWLAGHGYASSFFYGDTFLAVPAFLRIVGFDINSSLKIYITLVNLSTSVIAYISFAKCFKNRYIGLFGCALYTLSPYRIYNIYNRGAVGEFTAMIFFPLLVWGFYRIYTHKTEDKAFIWNWVIPVIGFSGLIQSHALSCEMAGIFVVIMCLVMWKRTFSPRVFVTLSLVVIMTVMINLWFIVPFVDLMMADGYYFGNNAGMMIQERGIYPAQIFYTLQAAGSSSRFHETGMLDTEPIGMGIALHLSVGLWLYKRFQKCNAEIYTQRQQERIVGDIIFTLCLVALFMSTNRFPWNAISSLGGVFATLVGSLQFPTRLTAIVTILAVTLSCIMGKWMLEDGLCYKKENDTNGVLLSGNGVLLSGNAVLVFIVAISVLFTTYQVNDTLMTRMEFLKIYSSESMGHSAVLGAEYLPLGAEMSHMSYHGAIASEGVSLTNYEKDGLCVEAHIKSDIEGYVDLPMLFYKGYQARNLDSGGKMTLSAGDNYDVRLEIPAGFEGNVEVKYTGMWYWHVAEAVSICTGAGLIIYYILRRRKAA